MKSGGINMGMGIAIGAGQSDDGPVQPSAPNAPVLSGEIDSGDVTLSWTLPAANGSAIIRYDIYAAATPGASVLVGSMDAPELGALLEGVVAETYYRIKAVSASGLTSGYSNEVHIEVGPATLTVQIAADGDDVVYTSGAHFPSTSAAIGNNGMDATNSMLRFNNAALAVLKNKTILTAVLELSSSAAVAGTVCNVNIKLFDVDTATIPANPVSSPPAFTAAVAWNAIPAWTDAQTINTPDFAARLQSVVNRAGWDMTTIGVALQNNASSAVAFRTFAFRELAAGRAAKLIVTYS